MYIYIYIPIHRPILLYIYICISNPGALFSGKHLHRARVEFSWQYFLLYLYAFNNRRKLSYLIKKQWMYYLKVRYCRYENE